MDKKKIRQERLFYLEFLALFKGKVSRKDLVTYFGISEAAATKDLALYAQQAPDILCYSTKEKAYLLCGTETHFEHDVEQSLFSLCGERAIALDTDRSEHFHSWICPNIKRKQSLKLASAITRCIYLGLKMKAKYFSKDKGEKIRLLTPLAMFNDGLCWRIRCYDHDTSGQKYKDYNLERFKEVTEDVESDASLDSDIEWNQKVTVRLTPHPKSEHPETILNDYDFSHEGNIEVELGASKVGYFLKKWHVDCSGDKDGNPNSKQLCLNNKEELLERGVPAWAFTA